MEKHKLDGVWEAMLYKALELGMVVHDESGYEAVVRFVGEAADYRMRKSCGLLGETKDETT